MEYIVIVIIGIAINEFFIIQNYIVPRDAIQIEFQFGVSEGRGLLFKR
jgi:hypothetical protein